MDVQELKESFKPHLPKGFIDKIRKRLLVKGINRSRSYIGYVCDPKRLDYDDEIITEALDLAAEQKRLRENIGKKAQSLK